MANVVETYSDAQLIEAIGAGSERAFDECYKRYSTSLYLFVLKRLRDEEEAKDIVQEIFVVLWNKRMGLRIRESLRAYLYKAAYNQALNYFKRQKNKERYIASFARYLSATDVDEVYSELTEQEIANVISAEIEKMPTRMRQIFKLSRNELMSYKEIAASLGIATPTVRTQVKRALRILRAKIETLFTTILLIGLFFFKF